MVSPPKYRHDGTSPLPLGLEASPAPRQWQGRSTVWPHDSQGGWTYCVYVPSCTMLPTGKAADGSELHTTAFYKVQVGIQSPAGISSMRPILRRFSDFLKLHSALKKQFPTKKLSSPPPKNQLRLHWSAAMLDQRRRALEDWLWSLLDDIEVSRSGPIAIFLDLEGAARHAMAVQEEPSSVDSPSAFPLNSSASTPPVTTPILLNTLSGDTSSLATSEADSETESITTDRQTGLAKAISLQPMSRFSSDLSASPSLEDDKAPKLQKFASDTAGLTANRGGVAEPSGSQHRRTASDLSLASNLSEMSRGEGSLELPDLGGLKLALPLDQRGGLRRMIGAMQRRLSSAKADMEEVVTRLKQEGAVREFLQTKVKDLEADLDKTRASSRELLQQAVAAERERVTELQWELEEARGTLLSAEEALSVERAGREAAEARTSDWAAEKASLEEQLTAAQAEGAALSSERDAIDAQAKTDKKILAKEVKALRKAQVELRAEVARADSARSTVEEKLAQETARQKQQAAATAKLLHEVETLRGKLRESSVESLAQEDDRGRQGNGSVANTDSVDLLALSDNRLGCLLAEAQLLAQENDPSHANGALANGGDGHANGDHGAVRKALADMLTDNAQLRRALNSTLRALFTSHGKEDAGGESEPTRRSGVLSRFL